MKKAFWWGRAIGATLCGLGGALCVIAWGIENMTLGIGLFCLYIARDEFRSLKWSK